MAFTIISPTRVEIDGQDAGLLGPFIRAHPELAAQIDAELIRWHASHVRSDQERDKARDDQIAAIRAECDARIAAADARVAQAEAVCDAKMADAADRVAKAEADLAVLGTPEQAEAKRKADEIAKLQDVFAEAGRRLQALKGGAELTPSEIPAMTSTPESRT